jgi:hypothetical protein
LISSKCRLSLTRDVKPASERGAGCRYQALLRALNIYAEVAEVRRARNSGGR